MTHNHVVLLARIPQGVSILVAADSMTNLATMANCFIEVDFNGCKLMAGPHEDPRDLVQLYERFQAGEGSTDPKLTIHT